MVIESVSRKTVVASSKETPCSFRLSSALRGSHSNSSVIRGLYTTRNLGSIGITATRSTASGARADPRKAETAARRSSVAAWCWTVGRVHAADPTFSRMNRGCRAAMRNRAIAGPSGRRRPCSQFRSVCTLMPMASANRVCVKPTNRRKATISSPDSIRWEYQVADCRRSSPAVQPTQDGIAIPQF